MLSRLFSSSSLGLHSEDYVIRSYQPIPRWGHSAAGINGKLYIWGGCMHNLPKVHSSSEKTQLLSIVDVFDPRNLVWEQKTTTGMPPLGVYWNAYTSSGKYMYTFGGYCGHGKCYHNSVHQLDAVGLQWREVMASNPSESPMRKWQCGMVAFTKGEENLLCVFGGWGVLSTNHKNMKHEFVADRANLGCVWSNELHFFNLSKGTWESPVTTGTPPPPCQGFTFTQVDSDRVVLFGGFEPTTRRRTNDVYILNLHTKHWIRIFNRLDPTIPWPVGRDDHSACVKNGTCPLLLTIGGVSNQFNTLGDLWILDIDSGRWKQVSAPQAVVGRRGHSVMGFSLGPRHFLLVIYGGISEWLVEKSHREQPIVTETAVLELCESDGGDWKVLCEEPSRKSPNTSVLIRADSVTFGAVRENGIRDSANSHFQEGRLRRGRSSAMTLDRRSMIHKQLEESKKEVKTLQGQLIDAVNALKKAKRDAEEVGKKKLEVENEAEKLKKQLEQMQAKLMEVEEKAQGAEKTIKMQNLWIQDLKSQKILSTSNSPSPDQASPVSEILIQSDESLQQLWLISPDEIQLTQAELARDSWSSIYVASYRGLHVAVKCFKGVTLTENNKAKYLKAMNIVVKARHPNITQFIGATLEPSPMILTELMPTTLKMTLRQGPLPKRQVLSVASDIAGALNYLHQWVPDPIIHRNISTSTILLEPMGNNTWRAKISDCASSNFTSHLCITSSSSAAHMSIFMAPEAKAPELHSPKMDVYSFGVVLLEMCQPAEDIAPTNDLRPRLQRLTWISMASLVRACTSAAPADRLSMNNIIKRLSSGGTNTESLV